MGKKIKYSELSVDDLEELECVRRAAAVTAAVAELKALKGLCGTNISLLDSRGYVLRVSPELQAALLDATDKVVEDYRVGLIKVATGS